MSAIDLYWLPLGAGGHSVRLNGLAFEAIAARLHHRGRADLYHSALQVYVPEKQYVVDQGPAWSEGSRCGVVGEGAGSAAGATGSSRTSQRPSRAHERRLTQEPELGQRLLDLAPQVPTPVWGRDELGTGEMWNSNSTISWLLARAGSTSTPSLYLAADAPGLARRDRRRTAAEGKGTLRDTTAGTRVHDRLLVSRRLLPARLSCSRLPRRARASRLVARW
jgi:hypothetical protein